MKPFHKTAPFHLVLIVLCLIPILQAGCSGTAKPSESNSSSLTKVKLQLNWVPEAEHGGFYAADVHGYYKEAGLDVEIVPGGVAAPVLQQVVLNRVEFGVANADVAMMGRNDDARIKIVMAPIQNSPRCIMVRPEVNAKSLQDLKNITLSATPGRPFLLYMKKKLPLPGVKNVRHQSMQGFFVNKNYAQQGYSFSEPFLAEKQNIKPSVLMVSDLGYNPYTSCVVTSDSLIQKNPALVRKFVQASIKGWEHYYRDPEPTNKKISSINPDQDEKSLQFAISDLRKLSSWNENEKKTNTPVGQMTAQRLQLLAKQLQEVGLLKDGNKISRESFSLEFLEPAGKEK